MNIHKTDVPNFKKPVLIYIPCYNCLEKIPDMLSDIPRSIHDKIECLAVDNQSTRGNIFDSVKIIKNKNYPFKTHLLRTRKNLGYAGSQKLCYSFVIKSPAVKYVVMLYGDGQYPAFFLKDLIALCERDFALVNGYRDKKVFGNKEKTPFLKYYFIKFSNILENKVTGMHQKEWHSGFVMYKRNFLEKIPLYKLSIQCT